MERIELKPVEFVNSAVDSDIEEPLWSVVVEKGVWKNFSDTIYDQTNVDAYSCTIVATFTALSNLTGKMVAYSMMKETLARMEKDGKFRSGFWAYLSDGVKYALEDFNELYKTSYKSHMIYLSPSSIIEGLKHSPVVTGIKYGKKFVPDSEDNAWLDGAADEVAGNQGHAICIVKINTMDDVLVKLCNSYSGKLTKNVIGFDFNKYRKLMFNSGYYFTK